MESALVWEESVVGLGVLRRTGTGEPALNVELDVPWDVGVLTVPPVVPPLVLDDPLQCRHGPSVYMLGNATIAGLSIRCRAVSFLS